MVGIQGLFFTWFSFLPIPYVFAACGRLDRSRYACCDRFLDSFRPGGSPHIRFGLPCCGGLPHPFLCVDVVPLCRRDHVYDGNQSLLLRPKYPSAANFSYRPAFISGLRFFRMLAILVRSARASDPLGVWMFLGQMFLGHVTIDPVGSPDLWCSV